MKQLFKTIFKYRLSSILTLVSLVVAFLGIIVLTLYVSYERSFDGFHKNKNDIYLMSFKYDMGSSLPVPMEELIRHEVPRLSEVLSCANGGTMSFTVLTRHRDAIRKKQCMLLPISLRCLISAHHGRCQNGTFCSQQCGPFGNYGSKHFWYC